MHRGESVPWRATPGFDPSQDLQAARAAELPREAKRHQNTSEMMS